MQEERTIPPNRINNPMAALELLDLSEFWLFRSLWYLPPASESSKGVRDIIWLMELLQADLEQEFRVACRRHLDDQTP